MEVSGMRATEIDNVAEEKVKVENRGKNERHFSVGREKEHRFVTMMPRLRPPLPLIRVEWK
jgi:hypothetical protein